MNKLPDNIETQALSLPERQRASLVLKLLDSIERRTLQDPRHVEKAWLEEANRRYQDYLSGDEEAIPAEQVFAELGAEDH